MNDFKLDSRPNIKSGFTTPDGYFESLADRVMLNLPVQEVKVVPLYRRRPVWVTSAAAAFVLSISLLISENESVKTTAAVPDNKAIENYLINEAGITSEELSQVLNTEDLSEIGVSVDISDKDIEQYLSEENISLYE